MPVADATGRRIISGMDPTRRLRAWQTVTVGTLFAGYLGYYVCRSNLSVVTPLLLDEYGPAGLTKGAVGDVASVGIAAYAVGKLVNGVGADLLGGRRLFLAGLFASVLATLLFTLAPAWAPSFEGVAARLGLGAAVVVPLGIVWAGNRFAQSMGWGGLVQVAALWTEPRRLGVVMGFLSMSYLLGDAAARLGLGQLVRLGYGWREVFVVAAALLGAVGLAAAVLLRGRPTDVGLPALPPPPGTVHGPDAGRALSPRELVVPLLTSRAFWLVCGLNMGLTLIRETFNLWTPTYLRDAAGLDAGQAGVTSLVFPLTGAASAVLAGWAAGRLGGRYGAVLVPALLALAVALGALAFAPLAELPAGVRTAAVVGLVCAAAFSLIGPYTFCAGVLAVRLGGPRGGATAAGLIDTAGYLAAALAGSGVGRLADAHGWPAAFAALAAVALLAAAIALAYTLLHERTP